jgi:hypothetical protein
MSWMKFNPPTRTSSILTRDAALPRSALVSSGDAALLGMLLEEHVEVGGEAAMTLAEE